jgi:Zn-dependent M28 family amino/carboxypeptidase
MALLETAGAFMQLKKKPLRTIVFVWVNGEEKGLLGSQYYTNNPVFPLEKTLIDINLDMVGRTKMASDTGKIFGAPLSVTGPGELQYYSKKESTVLEAAVKETALKGGIKLIDKGADMEFGGSDHMSFWSKGVTAIMLHSGIHADLHTYRDDVDKIDFDKMERSARMCFLLGYKLGNQKERFKLDLKK